MLLLTLLLPAPWVVGKLVESWVTTGLGELHPGADYRYSRSWRRSRLEVRLADGSMLLAHGRHAPLFPPGLATFDGMLLPAGQPAPLQFAGRVGLGGGLTLSGEMDALDWITDDVSVSAENLELAVVSGRIHRLGLNAASLTAAAIGREPVDGPLALEDAVLDLVWRASDNRGKLAASLTVRRPGQPPSELDFILEEIGLEPLRLLIETILAWDDYRHDNLNRDMALLTVASAWQDIRQRGLTLELSVLELDGDFNLGGRWRFDRAHDANRIEGQGSRAALEAWAIPLIALGAGTGAGETARVFDELVEAMRERGWLNTEGERVTVSLP